MTTLYVDNIAPNLQSTVSAPNLNITNSMMPSGSVLQVVQARNDINTSMGTVTWTTAVSGSITPTSASSKILIMAKVSLSGQSGGYDASTRILRNGSGVGGNSDPANLMAGDGIHASVGYFGGESGETMSFQYLDSPATTSTLTYDIQALGGESVSTYNLNRAYSTSSSSHWANTGDCVVILMEIAG